MSDRRGNAALKRLQADPVAFRNSLKIDADGGPRLLGTCIDDWQAKDFAALDSGWRRVAGHKIGGTPYQRAYLERPRGHSKTSDLAVMVAWGLFASKRRLSGVAAAADRDQAKLLRDAVEKLVRVNPWLANVVEVQAHQVVNHHTGSTLEILSSDAASSYGLTPDFIIVDELTHWPKRDLWDSLLSSAAKRRHCLVIVISNAGYGQTWQWETREAIRTDPDWYFSRLDGPVASWISPKHLAEQRRLLPDVAYRRLWLNQWTTGSGDALREDDIAAALTLGGPLNGPECGWCYVAGLDIGLTRDATALVILGRHVGHAERVPIDRPPLDTQVQALLENGLIDVDRPADEAITYHPGTGGLKLAGLHVWRPEGGRSVEVEAVEAAIVMADKRFGLSCVAFDPWQAQYLAERLRKQRIRTHAVDFTGPNLKAMCTETLEAFNERNLELYPDKQLLADLRALRVEERSYGVRLTSPRGPNGHGDAATALSIALFAARRTAKAALRINRPLLAAVYGSA